MMKIILLAAIPLVTLACCPPKQWRGIAFADYNTQREHIEISEGLVYDGIMNVLVANMTMTINGKEIKQIVYQNLTASVQYVVGEDGHCQMENITAKVPGCVPKESNILHQSYIGAGSSMVKTTIYQYMEGKRLSYLTVTDEGCIPVFYESTGDGIKVAAEFMGMEAVSTDASYFTLPVSCS